MKLLEERILKDGRLIGEDIVKVDSFLNHQIDVALVRELGEEFRRLFTDKSPTKILTIESSGIALAVMTAAALGDLPMVFAKKTVPSTMTEDMYVTSVRSFTKGTVSHVVLSKRFLDADDRVLIIDDFLAHGEAGLGMLDLVRQAGATPVGVGVAIEKMYQGGGDRIIAAGVEVHSLAAIEKIVDGCIIFGER